MNQTLTKKKGFTCKMTDNSRTKTVIDPNNYFSTTAKNSGQ